MKEKICKRETKKPMTVMVKPSAKKGAAAKAKKTGISLSQAVENMLYEYAK